MAYEARIFSSNACEKALLLELDEKLRKREKVGDMSVVAIDKDGNFGFLY